MNNEQRTLNICLFATVTLCYFVSLYCLFFYLVLLQIRPLKTWGDKDRDLGTSSVWHLLNVVVVVCSCYILSSFTDKDVLLKRSHEIDELLSKTYLHVVALPRPLFLNLTWRLKQSHNDYFPFPLWFLVLN